MVQLLQKYRIRAETHLINASELSVQPSVVWQKKYEDTGFPMGNDKAFRNDGDETWKEASLNQSARQAGTGEGNNSKSASIVRLAELIDEQSQEASCIFVTMPVRESNLPPGRYMSWLDILSLQQAPVVLIRGVTDKPVLTYYA